jgi:phosphoribosylformylglycinamidine synthase
VAEGGLLVAVAESCLAGGVGARLERRPLAALATALTPGGRGARRAARPPEGGGLPDPLAAALFGEAPGTAFVVSGDREALDRLEARTHLVELGRVGGDALAVGEDLAIPLGELREAHAALAVLFP